MLVFISYSHIDKKVAEEFAQQLNTHNIEFFLDEKDIQIGVNINEKIESSLNNTTHIIAIISPASIKSNWVAYEIGLAKGKQIEILPFLTHPSIDVPSFISHLNYKTNVNEVIVYLDQINKRKNEPSDNKIIPKFTAWSTWGGIKSTVEIDQKNSVAFSGDIESAAGLEINGNLPYGGKTLALKITGTKRCSFNKHKLFKIEANDTPLKPKDINRVNLGDSDYIDAEDGVIKYALPRNLTKLNIVFWRAKLNNLIVTATFE